MNYAAGFLVAKDELDRTVDHSLFFEKHMLHIEIAEDRKIGHRFAAAPNRQIRRRPFSQTTIALGSWHVDEKRCHNPSPRPLTRVRGRGEGLWNEVESTSHFVTAIAGGSTNRWTPTAS